MIEKDQSRDIKLKPQEITNTERLLNNTLGSVKLERALEYALISMVGAWIGFLAWAPRPDLLVSNTVEQIQSIIK